MAESEQTEQWAWAPLDIGGYRLQRVQVRFRTKGSLLDVVESHIVSAVSPAAAAELLQKDYDERVDAARKETVEFCYITGFPLFVLQPAKWVEAGLWDPFVPGEWICPKCGLRMSKKLLDPANLSASVNDSDEPVCCMNDSTVMDRVTWKQACADAVRINREISERADRLEAAWPEGLPMPDLDGDDSLIN